MPDSNSAIPIEAILKLIVDRGGEQQVEKVLKQQEDGWGKIEQGVKSVGTQVESVGRSVAGLVGVAGVGALVDKFVKLETSASNVALAMGKVTGGPSAYHGIGQELLGVQSRTGVSTGESEAALRALAMSVGLSPKPGQAGMLAEVVAGYSKVTGMSSASLAGILGPMLQAEGRGTSSSAAAYTLGEARANLGAFPGSQIEGMLPVVSGLATSAALGTPRASGKGVDTGGIAAMINTISGSGALRNPELAQQAAQGIGGTLQGAYQNPRMYAFLKMAGVGFKEQQLGFNNPKVMEKVTEEANRQYPGDSEADWKERRMLYLEFGQGEAGADALEKLEAKTKSGGIHVATPKVKREAKEAHKAQTLTTPEAKLKKVEGGVQSWLFSSPLHAALGAAGLLGGTKLLGKGLSGLKGLLSGGGEAGEAAEGAEGSSGAFDLLQAARGVAAAAGSGSPEAGASTAGGALLGAGAAAGLGVAGGVLGGLFLTNPTFQSLTGGGLAGNVTGSSRKSLENHANATAVSGVAAAAQKKFGSSWNSSAGVKWMEHELNSPHSKFDQETSIGIGESQTSMHPWAATHLLKQALGQGAPQAGGGGEQAFSEAVKQFKEAVEKLTHPQHSASYTGGASMHSAAYMGAPAVAAMQASVPGMVMAAFLGKASQTGTAPGAPTTQLASFNSPSKGGTAGIGGIVESIGEKMRMSPKQILAAEMAAGDESGWSNITHYTPGEEDSLGVFQQKANWGSVAERTNPSRAAQLFYNAEKGVSQNLTPAQMAQAVQHSATPDGSNYQAKEAEAKALLRSLAEAMHLHVHVEVGGAKVEQHKTKIGSSRVQAT